MLRHVERAGFDPAALERVRGNIRRYIQARMAPTLDVHYYRHRDEFPQGTTRDQYVDFARIAVRQTNSGVFVSRYGGALQLGVVAWTPKGGRGEDGSDLMLIEYRVDTSHWVTAYQLQEGLNGILSSPSRENVIWLRHLKT